jgi:putative membrane protein
VRAAILLVALLSAALVSIAHSDDFDHMGNWNHMWGYGGGVVTWLILVLIAAGVIYAVVQASKSRQDGSSLRETPLEILKKRYAAGEITLEEFEERKRHLKD